MGLMDKDPSPEDILHNINKEYESTTKARKNIDADIKAAVEEARIQAEEEELAKKKRQERKLPIKGGTDLEKLLLEIWELRGPHKGTSKSTECLKRIKLFFFKWQLEATRLSWSLRDFIVLSKIAREDPVTKKKWTDLMVDCREFNYKALGKINGLSSEGILASIEAGIAVEDYESRYDTGASVPVFGASDHDDNVPYENPVLPSDTYNNQFANPIGPCGESKQRLLLKCDDKIDWLLNAIVACKNHAGQKEWTKIEDGMIEFVGGQG
jgi:hypothetical protein